MNQLTIGTDLECFLRNRKTGIIESAIPVIKEGKDNPRDLGKGFKVLHDNALLEFNVPYSKSRKQFIANLREGLKRMTSLVGKKYELVAQASHEFDPKFLKDRDANIFGCSAEFDAWEMKMVRPPDCHTNLRSCGGHLHFGREDFQNPSDQTLMEVPSKARTIRLMDLFLGIPFTILESNDPTNKDRKKLYGRASFHRPTPFGCEYRVLTNFWMRSPKLTGLAFDLAMLAIRAEIENKADSIIAKINPDEIVSIINTASKDRAKELLNELPIPASLKKRIAILENQKFSATLEKEWKI